ncbi:hypothetical protein TWF730_000086 [Orbilia blumenaviensis]|uniref:Rieske domain-containing protein n=1 Tax=Orbilia blumenaviensis TaxID=1796055 RepID=A0AAV9VLV5_9PEZI
MSVNNPSNNPGLSFTSGRNDPVWIKSNPYDKWPRFKKLEDSIETHTVIAGAGVAGISTAYELVKKGVKVVLVEAREVASGESGRSNGVIGDYLGLSWQDFIKLHGTENARLIYESHRYAITRVHDIAEELGIECEIRRLPCHIWSKTKEEISGEIEAYNTLIGLDKSPTEALLDDGISHYETFKVADYTTLHPTKYLNGILRYLSHSHSDLFSCYTHTRVKAWKEDQDGVVIDIEGRDVSIKAKNFVMAINVPVRSRTYIMKNAYYRTYHIATTIPTTEAPEHITFGSVDIPEFSASVAFHADPSLKYLIVSGGRHKTGHIEIEAYETYFRSLKKWVFENFPTANTEPEFCWSSQVVDSNDHLAFVGREKPDVNMYVITSDSGSGLNYGIIGARIVSDQITGIENPWEVVYDAARNPKSKLFDREIEKVHLDELVSKSREPRNYLVDIEDMPRCTGAIISKDGKELGMPLAVYKDADGKTRKFTGLCPHAFGVLIWNPTEKSFDCPLHGSRFDAPTGRCVFGPANAGLKPDNDAAREAAATSVEL